MLTRDRILQLLREQAGYLASEFGITRMSLFGSFARDEAPEASDVDLLVELRRPAQQHAGDSSEKLARMRDRLIHHYFGINLDVVW